MSTERSALGPYWSRPIDQLAAQLATSTAGLSSDEAARRRDDHAGRPFASERTSRSRMRVLLRQVESPLLWLLLIAAGISLAMQEWSDATIVLVIVGATIAIGYVREYRAERALAALQARIRTMATVVRDGQSVAVERDAVVAGDVMLLSAGSLVPADGVVIDASDCFASESALTGESFPVSKEPGPVAETAGVPARRNCVFLGTNIRSGTARCLVVATGRSTELARIATHLQQKPPETDFDRGLRRFGYFLATSMFVIVIGVFAAHTLRGRPPIETLLFSVALAVGLNPELLPAILSVNLARGAQMMAQRGVIVRRLNAIENLGSMTVLCTDKTGTLTEGVVSVDGAYDPDGRESADVLALATTNAALQTGLANPLDAAILQQPAAAATSQPEKIGEIPFDFVRKRLSVVVEGPDGPRLITKGAVTPVMSVCTRTASGDALDDAVVAKIHARYEAWSAQGLRVIAVATRTVASKPAYGRDDEADLTLAGFVTFLDRPKEGAAQAVADLARLAVSVKVITGDNRHVAAHVASMIGMSAGRILTGEDLDRLDDPALHRLAPDTTLFVEVDPNQKERIIRALRRGGAVVGFLGDGVNDAPAMHAADTSISVDGAADVARATADFVLLERDLDVIRGGVEEGRRTFANTLKYILTTTSANLGNMISMAAASIALPFLPMLAGQILLNNLLSDVPAVGIADDRVDPEMVERPPRWDLPMIARYMIVFGLVSSAFDVLTFAILLWDVHASPDVFRTGWFVESLLTELVVALVVRTRRVFYRSRPGALLLWSSVVMIAITPVIPFLPGAGYLGFVPLSSTLLMALTLVTVLYVAATELAKRWFYRGVRGILPAAS
ncbi:MAG TPA: magnesium-translocating P-type ATPase [Vicinamibacterales bacterium]|jgi:Mg2+-importing ATPase|nr:magnesium-translocating P-type ATPase [Vicinamibacterales bacterium]